MNLMFKVIYQFKKITNLILTILRSSLVPYNVKSVLF